jgi:hypothetical protein
LILTEETSVSDIKASPSHTPAKATYGRKGQLATATHPAARVVDGGEAMSDSLNLNYQLAGQNR